MAGRSRAILLLIKRLERAQSDPKTWEERPAAARPFARSASCTLHERVMNGKSPGYEEAVNSIRAAAGAKARLAFVAGNFNIVHPGHLRLLKFAREQADFLVVGVYPDSNPGVSLPLDLRVDGVSALSYVDFVVRLEEGPIGFIEALRPDIVVKGNEYAERVNEEEKLLATMERQGSSSARARCASCRSGCCEKNISRRISQPSASRGTIRRGTASRSPS